jgi:excisionase family DNA binding protein
MEQLSRMLYPVPEGAEKLGVGRTTMYELIKAGEIRTVRIRGKQLVSQAELETYVAKLRRAHTAPDAA